MKKLLLLLLFTVPAFGQNVRYTAPFPSVSATTQTPFLVANIPPNSPILAVCNSPANQVPCTNYRTTYTGAGVPCPNGAQDTPDPNATTSACQQTGDAQGNIGFWAPAGTLDYTVCIGINCYGPFTVTLGGSSGTGNVTTSATLTAGLPLIGNGGVDVATGTKSGNTTKFTTTTGALTSGHCVQIDASGNLVDSGGVCGGGGGGGNVFLAPAGDQNVIQPASGGITTKFSSNNFANIRYVTPSWNWSQSPAGTLSIGANTVTLTPCPVGIDTSNFVASPYYISVNGTAEQVKVTGGTCTSGAASGTVVFTTLNNYGAGFTLGSSSQGIQEAINDACKGSNYAVAGPGDCQIELVPGTTVPSYNNPSYNVRAPIYLGGRQMFRLRINGNRAVVKCTTRDVCLFMGSRSGAVAYTYLDNISMVPGINIDGVQIADVTAAAGTYTVHTASAHPFSMTANHGEPDFVDVSFNVNTPDSQGHFHGIVLLTSVADNTHFTFVSGAGTFANAAGYGAAVLENALVEDNADGSEIRDFSYVWDGTNVASYVIVIDNDQHLKIDNYVERSGAATKCTANFCGAQIYVRGDVGNSGIVDIVDSEISLQCGGNGVLALAGNGLTLSGQTVIQGQSQYDLFSVNGFQPTTIANLYEESTGACNNPQPPAVAQKSQAGLISYSTSPNSGVNVVGAFPFSGTFPTFVTGGGGGSQINYWVVFHSSTTGYSTPLPIGVAQPLNGAVTINGAFPYLAIGTANFGTVTYDLLATTGSGTQTPIFGTQTIAVAINQTCTPTTNGWCTFSDTQAARTSYAVPGVLLNQFALPFWPGGITLTGDSTIFMDEAPYGIVSTKANATSVIAHECSNNGAGGGTIALQMSTWYSCLANDGLNGTTIFATIMQQPDQSNNSIALHKGRLNFGNPGNQIGGPGQHIITIFDSNILKTIATGGHRPLADAGDAYLGVDCTSSSICLTIGARDSISTYLNNLGFDGTSWKTRLNSTGFTFQTPMFTNSQITSTLATGTAPVNVTSTTLNSNLNAGLWNGFTILSTTDSPGAITVNAGTCTDRGVALAALLTTATLLAPTANYALDANILTSAAQAVAGTLHYRICNPTGANITLNAAATFNLRAIQ